MKKGQTNNPNGRPRGVPNRTTRTAREWLVGLIDKNRVQIEKDLKKLNSKDRLIILEKLMSYTIPKVNSMQISFDQLTTDQIDLLINELTQSIKDENKD